MLNHTFIHLPYVGRKTEQKYWQKGIHTWQHLSEYLEAGGKKGDRYRKITEALENTLKNKTNPEYFQDLLPARERWRIYPDFMDSCVFLDIETTGTSTWENEITVIGTYNGREFKQFVNGINLEEFENEIYRYKLVVTFNGSTFDLPFIRYYFRHFEPRAAHIDLRYVMADLGYHGGLKSIEKELGLERPSMVQGFSGWEAVWLWERYRRGDNRSLELLLEYNRQDVVNLKKLLEFACEQHVSEYISRFLDYRLPWST